MLKRLMQNMYMRAHSHHERNILSLVEPNSNASLVDLGCDDGHWSKRLGERAGSKHVSGVEFVPARLAIAVGHGIQAVDGDLNKTWPLADSSFDFAHSSFVIEHVDDIDHYMRETIRILKPGGYTIVSTENGSSWHNIIAAIMGWQTFSSSCCSTKFRGLGNPIAQQRGYVETHPGQRHKVIFNYRGFKEFFEVYGFKNISIRGAGYYPLPSAFGAIDPRHSHFITIKAFRSR